MNNITQEISINVERFMMTTNFEVWSAMHGPKTWKSYVVGCGKKIMSGGFEDNQEQALENLNSLVVDYIKQEEELLEGVGEDD
jgi:hypothetical protein